MIHIKANREFIFVNGDFDDMLDPNVGIFRDLYYQNDKTIKFLPLYMPAPNSILSFFRRVVLSFRVNRIINIPFKDIFFSLLKYDYEEKKEYIIILPTIVIGKLSVNYLKKLKQKYTNIKIVALVIDSMKASSFHLDFAREKLFSDVWDLILTFDKNDAKEFDFTYFGYSYYSSFDEVKKSNRCDDIYYVGFYKGGRESLIGKLFDYLSNNNIICNFNVVSLDKEFVKGSSLKTKKKKFSYPEVISDVKSANCILEILQNGQKTQTIRYFEAVVYNKKLLSNNPFLHTLPFYDERYMKYFENTSDIDIDWVRKEEVIDYGYNGEFSPVHMISFIEKYFDELGSDINERHYSCRW